MREAAIITVDVGTSSLRSVLFDARGVLLHKEQRDNPPNYLPGGRVEQDSDSWLRELYETLAACARIAELRDLSPLAVSLTAQRSSVIPVDKDGRALHPAIMWQDTRTEGLASRLEPYTRKVFQKSGLRPHPIFSAVKMAWFREEMPELYSAAHKMLGIQDLLLRSLTGSFVTDRSLASRTNLFNLETLDWDAELLEIFGVDSSLLCSLIDPGAVAGGLTREAAAKTGLPQGLPVISAGGDQQCAALGLGLTGPGKTIANTGTGSYLITGTSRPLIDPDMGLSCNVAALPGSYILEAGIPTSGSVFRWFNREFYRDAAGGENDFSDIVREAESSPPGARGLILLPSFKGRGSPRWDPAARGAFLNLSLDSSRADLARAILEGICAEFAENLSAMEALGAAVERVEAAGGMSASGLYLQILADSLNRPVERPAESEATALGAWISAAVRMGLYPSFQAAHEAASACAAANTGTDAAEPFAGAAARFQPEPSRASLYRNLRETRKRAYEALSFLGGAGEHA